MDNFEIKNEFNRLHEKSESKVSNNIFYWVIGGLCVGILGTFFYILNRIDSLNTWQIDHDKIIQLQTEMNLLKEKNSDKNN